MCCGAPATFMIAWWQLCGRCSASIKPKNVPTQPLHVKTLRYRTTWRWLYTITNIFEPCSFWHVRICRQVLMWLARLPDKIKKRHAASHAQTTDPPSDCQEARKFGNIPFLTWLKFVHNGGPVPHMSRGRSRGRRCFWERRVAWQRHMQSFRFVSFYITPVSTKPPASAHH